MVSGREWSFGDGAGGRAGQNLALADPCRKAVIIGVLTFRRDTLNLGQSPVRRASVGDLRPVAGGAFVTRVNQGVVLVALNVADQRQVRQAHALGRQAKDGR